jgi:hypothetical protein
VGTHASRPPSRAYDRLVERRVPCPQQQGAYTRLASLNTTRPRSVHRMVATHKTARRLRWQGPGSLPRYRARAFLSTRTPFRVSYATWMGGTSPHDTPTKAGPRVVA